MTHSKKHDIEVWRKTVNRTLRENERSSRYSSSYRNSEKPIKSKNYQPPGEPTGEPGFRRIPIPRDLRKDLGKQRFDWKVNRWTTDAINTIESDMTRLSMAGGTLPSPVPQDSSSETEDEDEDQPQVEPGSLESINSHISDMSRSTSNRLLNVITIDDYKMRYGGSYSRIDPIHHMRENIIYENGHQGDGGAVDDQTQRPPIIAEDVEGHMDTSTLDGLQSEGTNARMENKSEAVQKGFRVMLKDDRPFQSFKNTEEREYAKHEEKTQGSRRFRRLHKALHQWMDEELLRPRQLRYGMRHRSHTTLTEASVTLTDAPRSAPSTSLPNSRRGSQVRASTANSVSDTTRKHSSNSTHKDSTNKRISSPIYRKSASSINRRGPGSNLSSSYEQLPYQNGRLSSSKDTPDTDLDTNGRVSTARSTDNFLEMLMEMDDREETELNGIQE